MGAGGGTAWALSPERLLGCERGDVGSKATVVKQLRESSLSCDPPFFGRTIQFFFAAPRRYAEAILMFKSYLIIRIQVPFIYTFDFAACTRTHHQAIHPMIAATSSGERIYSLVLQAELVPTRPYPRLIAAQFDAEAKFLDICPSLVGISPPCSPVLLTIRAKLGACGLSDDRES